MIQDYTMVFLMLMIVQSDLNFVYEWGSDNNMFVNAQKFQYIYVLTLILHYHVMFTPVPV